MPDTITLQEQAVTEEKVTEGRKHPIDSAVDAVERTSPQVYVAFALGSIALSLGLYVAKKRESAIFVGLWPSTFLALGLLSKLVGIRQR